MPRAPFSDVEFASFLVYPQSGQRPRTDTERKAKNLIINMKQLRVSPLLTPPDVLDFIFTKLEAEMQLTPALRDYLSRPGVGVIAAPGSGLTRPFSVSCPPAIAKNMVLSGLATRVLPPVHRMTPVPKAAFAAAADRPTAQQHYDSMGLPNVDMNAPTEILVVDDVVTRGATLLAAVTWVRAAYPRAQVRAFAMARTGQVRKNHIADPVVGRIEYRDDGSTVRRP